MSDVRRTVLKTLADHSDATGGTTTVVALAESTSLREDTVRRHVEGLRDCDLATRGDDGGIRVTVTGEELLALDVDGPVVVDASE